MLPSHVVIDLLKLQNVTSKTSAYIHLLQIYTEDRRFF